jgi:hypothetical protein
MNATQNVTIPYEKQSGSETGRMCGAACLSMVYRSVGREVPQSEIWLAIAKENRFGSLASTTHLMAKDALNRGISAVVMQARHPLQALWSCQQSGIRVILNHRLRRDAPTGHYSVLVDIDAKSVVLHDPYFGPSRRLSHAELLELWQPYFRNSEILGNALIGVAARPPAVSACQFCRSPMPANVECPNCNNLVGLQPGALLGCVNNTCIARMWNYICCPSCDHTWTFILQPPEAGASASDFPNGTSRPGVSSPLSPNARTTPAPADDQVDLKPLFGELDKFCSLILSLPGAANHPEIKKQVDFIAGSKEKLRLARTESLAYRKMSREQLTKLQEEAKQRDEAHRKKIEDLNRPLPPLDGNALGHALLKNLGLRTPLVRRAA